MKKKPTTYVIICMAILPVILSIFFWITMYATRVPSTYDYYWDDDIDTIEAEEVYQDVDKAVIYVGGHYWSDYMRSYSYDSCSVEGSFIADTLVIISTGKSINVTLDD